MVVGVDHFVAVVADGFAVVGAVAGDVETVGVEALGVLHAALLEPGVSVDGVGEVDGGVAGAGVGVVEAAVVVIVVVLLPHTIAMVVRRRG